MKPLAAAWALVSHPLRLRRRAPFYDDHGARHATRRRRAAWWAWNIVPAVLWVALAVSSFVRAEYGAGIAYTSAVMVTVVTTGTVRQSYLNGYMRGVVQHGIDARARSVGRPYDLTSRKLPHPADPSPDLSRLYGRIDDER